MEVWKNPEREKSGVSCYDYGARYYDPALGRFHALDPAAEKYSFQTVYAYAANNPIVFIDQDGMEPVKEYVGTAGAFKSLLDNSPRKVGTFKGRSAHNYMISLGNTKFNWKQMRPLPTQTGYFNSKKGRYIYTEKGGWIDMAHFMFYAGKAYQYKNDGIGNPVEEAVWDGFKQEVSDKVAAKHSAFSYEDLPSDKIGAVFGAEFFDPESDLSFGEQLVNYLNEVLGATNPENAPNYNEIPEKDSKNPPTEINSSVNPINKKEEKDKTE